jgi:hypothetical protein
MFSKGFSLGKEKLLCRRNKWSKNQHRAKYLLLGSELEIFVLPIKPLFFCIRSSTDLYITHTLSLNLFSVLNILHHQIYKYLEKGGVFGGVGVQCEKL